MRVLIYELKKLISYRAFLFISLVCIVMGALSSINNIRTADPAPGDYKRIASEIANMSESEAQEFFQQQFDEIFSEHPENSQYSGVAVSNSKTQFDLISGYGEFLDSIKENCKSITSISIFADKDSFAYRNTSKIEQAYENIKIKTLPLDVSQGVENILNNNISDILILFTIFAAAIFIFTKDKEIGIINLLYSYPKGRSRLCLNKIGALFFITVILNLLFMAVLTIISISTYGLGDLSRPIQSVNGYLECNFNFSVGEYLVVSLIFKILGSFLWSILFALICILSSNNAQIYGVSALISVTEVLLYNNISRISNFGLLHDFNLVSFIKPDNIFFTYRNLNIFGYPVNALLIISAVWLILTVAVLISVNVIYAGGKNQEYKRIHISIRKHSSAKVHKRLNYAFRKSLFLQGSLVVIVIWAVLLSMYHYNFSKPASPYDMYYKQYTTDYAGPINENTFNIIKQDEQYFADLDSKMMNGEFTTSEMNNYQSEQNRKSAFEDFKLRVEAIEDIDNTEIFYDLGYIRAFCVNSSDEFKEMALLIIFICALIISPLISYDNGRKLTTIIYSTTTGKKSYIKRNILITLIYTAAASFAVMIPYYINILLKYGTQGGNLPINSIKAFASFPIPITVWQFALGLFILRTILFSLISLIMLAVSFKSKSRFTAVLINITIFVIPAVCIWL